MNTVLTVAPHPDDEVLGCGGTLLRHAADGDRIHWLLVTGMTGSSGFAAEREAEIAAVADALGATVHELGHPTTRLDTIPLADLVAGVEGVLREVGPDIVYLPHPGDAHSDHEYAFRAAAAACKWFRCESVREIYAMEITSETRFGLDPSRPAFDPDTYVDIGAHLDEKIRLMAHYRGEMGEPPFPRSEEAVRALAAVRGAESGFRAAEAFQLLRRRR